METLVEFTHRVTAGFSFVLVVVLYILAIRYFPHGHRVRRSSLGALIFMIFEALIGAGLVLLRYVADDVSLGRALWMGGHLVNTYLLLGFLGLTAWFSMGTAPLRKRGDYLARLLVVLLGLLLFLGVSGALAALGDTLFPGVVGLRWDVHLFVSLRNFHPFIALAVSFYLFLTVHLLRQKTKSLLTLRLSYLTAMVTIVQLVVGAINILLLAPVGWQLTHLFFADLQWLCAIFLVTSYYQEDD